MGRHQDSYADDWNNALATVIKCGRPGLVCWRRFLKSPVGSLENGDMGYFALFYDVVNDFVSRRTAYREEHLRLAREAHRRGELLLAGAFTEPADRALLVFR